jgi:predicted DNA-binding transcriptional regulator AlpA
MSLQTLDQRRRAPSARKRKLVSQAEADRCRRQSEQSDAVRDREIALARRARHRDRVLTFRQWCELNGFSKVTGWRIIKSGNGPPILQLSARRIGIKESDNAAWQASCVR